MGGWVKGVVLGVAVAVCAGAVLSMITPRAALASQHHDAVHASYPLGNGNDVYAYWNRGERNVPWVVNVHGGYWHGGSGHRPDLLAWAQHEQARGYAAFTVDYRLVPQVQWPTPERDVAAAVRWIRAHADTFGLDLRKGFIIGGSAGGLLASVVALDHGGFAGVISMAGAVDPYDEYRHDPDTKLRAAALALLGGRKPAQDAAGWRSARAMNHLGTHTMPFLLVHSKHDHTVSVHTAYKFRSELRAHGYPVTLVIRSGSSHVLRSTADRDIADRWMDATLASRASA